MFDNTNAKDVFVILPRRRDIVLVMPCISPSIPSTLFVWPNHVSVLIGQI